MDGHQKRCRRWDEAGHAHALTFSCFRRQPFLSKDRSRRWMIEAIDRARTEHRFHLWAYVVMPEHVHLLVWPTEADYSVSAILKTMKMSVAVRAVRFLKKTAPGFLAQMEDRQPNGTVSHRFWQRGGGYDRNLTEPGTGRATMEYIHANPVRRELCQRPLDWVWSSAIEWERPGTGLLRLDRESPRPVRRDGQIGSSFVAGECPRTPEHGGARSPADGRRRPGRSVRRRGPGRPPADELCSLPFKEAVREFERPYLERLLARHGGNRKQTAEAAGIDPATMFRKLKRLG